MQFTVTRTVGELTDQELLTEYELALCKQATPSDKAVESLRAEVLSRMARRYSATNLQQQVWGVPR